jgi:2-dehydro-3-deoxyphosphogluconate aldolase / (4S)-4-hydroxy-2-oxoglutarate aldolase
MAMNQQKANWVLELIDRLRLVAIIRLDDLTHAVEISRALLDAGVYLQEYTLSNPAAIDAVAEVRKQIAEFNTGEASIGIGSVRTREAASQAIAAGAQFVVTPITIPSLIEFCRENSVPIMPGAYTPTEIATAWEAGASMVKVFPARSLGPSYIKDVLAPMPYLKLMPTGGIDLNNMQSYFDAGAHAVGVGGNIIDARAIAEQNWKRVTEVAKNYVHQAGRVTA